MTKLIITLLALLFSAQAYAWDYQAFARNFSLSNAWTKPIVDHEVRPIVVKPRDGDLNWDGVGLEFLTRNYDGTFGWAIVCNHRDPGVTYLMRVFRRSDIHSHSHGPYAEIRESYQGCLKRLEIMQRMVTGPAYKMDATFGGTFKFTCTPPYQAYVCDQLNALR